MSRMHQGSLRKAERAKVHIAESASAGLEDFYRLHLRTRRRLGVPIQPRRLFSLIKERILDQGGGFVLTASIGDRPVASGVFFVWHRSVIFKYAASDERSWEARPNHILAWWAMRLSCERDFRLFDWGRTDVGNDGLRTYKRAFGSDEQTLNYSWIGQARRTQAAPKLFAQSAAAIIRHSPEWLCQTIGEKFYGFAS
jgi:CelD/BcsL family acetyltransferase involved in cellulose biosynthesis